MESKFLSSFYFSLSFGADTSSTDAAFQEASGLSKEINMDDVVEGGENRFKYRLPTTTTFPNLVLKRGMTLETSALIDWCADVLDKGMSTTVTTKNVLLNLLNSKGQTCKSWTFNSAYPVKWSGAELTADKNAIFIETIELAYQYFEIGTSKS